MQIVISKRAYWKNGNFYPPECFAIAKFRDGGAYFKVGGGGQRLENERWRREFAGASGGILPPKILKSRGSEMVFPTFFVRYFLKKRQPR